VYSDDAAFTARNRLRVGPELGTLLPYHFETGSPYIQLFDPEDATLQEDTLAGWIALPLARWTMGVRIAGGTVGLLRLRHRPDGSLPGLPRRVGRYLLPAGDCAVKVGGHDRGVRRGQDGR
jgi:hypothetical protein